VQSPECNAGLLTGCSAGVPAALAQVIPKSYGLDPSQPSKIQLTLRLASILALDPIPLPEILR